MQPELLQRVCLLSCSAATYQRRLSGAHVLVFGVGGVGGTCLIPLTRLGVGRFTLLDCDVIELRNFARPFLYRHEDIGRPKVDAAAAWVRAYDSAIYVRAVNARVDSLEDLQVLMPGVDLVVGAANEPPDRIEAWINEACMTRGVPYVAGGINGREVVYWSVDPGRSGCHTCREHYARTHPAIWREQQPGVEANGGGHGAGIAPPASLIGGLMSLEAMRYLTHFAPPAAAGRLRRIDLCTSDEHTTAWDRWRDCPDCTRAPRPEPRAPAHTAARVALGAGLATDAVDPRVAELRPEREHPPLLRPLSVTAHHDDFLVGGSWGGEFVTIPPIDVAIATRDGQRLGDIAVMAAPACTSSPTRSSPGA